MTLRTKLIFDNYLTFFDTEKVIKPSNNSCHFSLLNISDLTLHRSELGKSINTDEAAALGAVYQAAYLGKGFKVKKFGVREGNIYPINVS